MPTIRHICAGHEYRYDTETGTVTNNYGTVRAVLLFCRFTGYALLYKTAHQHAIFSDTPIIAKVHPDDGPKDWGDARLAQFAIGQTAANIKED